jgi:integrase
MAAGIRTRHGRKCRSLEGGRCNCTPSYEAWVYSKRDDKKIRKTFHDLAEAKGWRADADSAVRRRTLRAPSKVTFAEAAEAWLEGARAGTILNGSGDRYKPSALRGYERALRLRVLPHFGSARLSEVSRVDVQDFVDALKGEGLGASTIHNTVMPLRVICKRAVGRGEIAANPTAELPLPAVRGRRARIASPAEAAQLLAALPEQDQPLSATAMYAGLRRGEPMALRWGEVDLSANVIRVERSWDVKAREIEPKRRVGRRTVPLAAVLRSYVVSTASERPIPKVACSVTGTSPSIPTACVLTRGRHGGRRSLSRSRCMSAATRSPRS